MYVRTTEQLILVSSFKCSLLVLQSKQFLHHTNIACTGALCPTCQLLEWSQTTAVNSKRGLIHSLTSFAFVRLGN